MIYTSVGTFYTWAETILMTTLGFVAGLMIHVALMEHARKTYNNWRYQLSDKLFIQENDLSKDFAYFKKWRM